MTNNTVTKNANKLELIPAAPFSGEGEIILANAEKLLGVTASARVSASECFGNELRVSGKIAVQGLYIQKDGGGFDSFSFEKDFTEALPINGEKALFSRVFARVTEFEYYGLTPLKMKFSFEIVGYSVKAETVSFLECCEDGVYCKKLPVKTENVLELTEGALETSFVFENETPLSKILTENTSVWVNNAFSSDGFYQIEGEAVSFITAADENGKLFCKSFSSPFSAEIADPNLRLGTELSVNADIKSVSVALDTENNNIAIDLNLCFSGYATEREEFEGITDAYSITNELITSEVTVRRNTCISTKLTRAKFSETVKLTSSVSKLECVLCPNSLSVISYNKNGLYAEGIISPTVIFKDGDGNQAGEKFELPYKLLLTKDFICSSELLPEVKLSQLNGRVRGVDEIELIMEFVFTVRGLDFEEFKLINEIETGEEIGENDFAISLYLARKGEELFDVAKELKTTEEILLKLNPDLKLPFEGGEKLLLYREL